MDTLQFLLKAIDKIGDLAGTSHFAKERKSWRQIVGADLTRENYNANKWQLQYHRRKIYDYPELNTSYSLSEAYDPFFIPFNTSLSREICQTRDINIKPIAEEMLAHSASLGLKPDKEKARYRFPVIISRVSP